MRDLVHLLPGSQLPTWVEHLEREVFTDPWGPLEAHEHLLGYPSCAYARWSVLPAAGEAELLRLAVAPAERRQGLARQLLEDSEAFLAQAGVGSLFLEVRDSNLPARALYEAMGWRFQRLRKAYYPDGEDALAYGKPLESRIAGQP